MGFWQERPSLFLLLLVFKKRSDVTEPDRIKTDKERKRTNEKKKQQHWKGSIYWSNPTLGEGDTLTSRLRCHGYQSPVCKSLLAPLSLTFPPIFSPDILVFQKQRIKKSSCRRQIHGTSPGRGERSDDQTKSRVFDERTRRGSGCLLPAGHHL